MIQQLSVFLQNEPGKLAAITTALAEGGIDLRALSIGGHHGLWHSKNARQRRGQSTGHPRTEALLRERHRVTIVAVPDVPGGLAGVRTMRPQTRAWT